MQPGRDVSELRPIFGGRLIKRVLVVLPEGSFLHSNCYSREGVPYIAETVGDVASRTELWERIRRRKLGGTKFYVYRDLEAYRLDMTLQDRPHV